MEKMHRKKRRISTLLICNVILTGLLLSSPIETFATPENGGVSPVNPLNPAITVEPTSPPKDSEPKSQKKKPAQTSKPASEETSSSSTEIKKEEEKSPAIAHRKQKKKSQLKFINELSDYPSGNEGAVSPPAPTIGGGSSAFIQPPTQTGQTLARLSGVLIYGRKYKV